MNVRFHLRTVVGLLAIAALSAPAPAADLVTADDFARRLSQPQPADTGRLRTRGIRLQPAAPAPAEVALSILFNFGTTEIADDFSRRQLDEAARRSPLRPWPACASKSPATPTAWGRPTPTNA